MSSKQPTAASNAHAEQPVLEPILLVDDNPTNLQVLYKTLQGRGYKLLVAKSGEDALVVARKAKPALILLDIMMPGIDGYETCRRLKADPKMNAAVIFMSALNETHDKVKGLDLGAVDYISKPFQAEEVIARVNTHLTLERLSRELIRKNASLEQANEKMTRDLAAAARVQRALLPTELPLCDRTQFAWVCRPCDELGGDALNVFRIDDRFMGLYVLDVSGHGVPASLLSVVVTRDLQPQRGTASVVTRLKDSRKGIAAVNPADVAIRLNALYPMSRNGQHYFTLLYGVLDTQTGRFRFVCAGHPGPIVLRRDGSTAILDAPALPIGLAEHQDYQDTVFDLMPGDRLFLHSDGINEEFNAQSEQFGRHRLCDVITATRTIPLKQAVDQAVQAVYAWRGHENLSDDASILALEWR